MRSFPESSYWLIRCGNGLFWGVWVGCRQGENLSVHTAHDSAFCFGSALQGEISMWNVILRNSLNLPPEHPPCKSSIL